MSQPSGHSVAWWITAFAQIKSDFTCHEPEDAPCRNVCKYGCDDGYRICTDCEGTDHRPVEGKHCEYCGTAIVPYDTCIMVEWMEADSTEASAYEGPAVRLHDGPITFVWHNDYFTWHYSKETP